LPPGTAAPADARLSSILNEAYDQLMTVSLWMSSDQAHLPREDGRLLDDAKEYYRSAIQANSPRIANGRRAEALGLAATDAARGLLLALSARAAPGVGLPPPPDRMAPSLSPPRPSTREQIRTFPPEGKETVRTPAESTRDMIRDVTERYRQFPESRFREQGGAFLESGRRSLDQARKALDEGKVRQAMQLAL